MNPGTQLTLDIQKPAGGGRMLSRHEGRVILVAGAIPGERVAVRIERVAKGVTFAETVDVLSASPDRRLPGSDLASRITRPSISKQPQASCEPRCPKIAR